MNMREEFAGIPLIPMDCVCIQRYVYEGHVSAAHKLQLICDLVRQAKYSSDIENGVRLILGIPKDEVSE